MNQDQQNRAPAEVTRSEASGPCAEWLGFGQGMSACGYERKLRALEFMSALHPTCDIPGEVGNVSR